MRSLTLVVFALLSVAAAFWVGTALAQLAVTIQTDKSEYIAREPVRLSVRYQNVGTDTLSLMYPSELGSNMEFNFYEVTDPDGGVVRGKHQFAIVDRITTEFTGEPLTPGEFIDLAMYPNLSSSLRGEQHRLHGFIFSQAGTYKLRLAYDVRAVRGKVRDAVDAGLLYSNEVTLEVREPNSEEAEILEAYWSANRGDLACGDEAAYVDIDESRTRSVIDKYPKHPLTDHLRYNLARGLLTKANEARLAGHALPAVDDEAVDILERLRQGGTFRPDEVHLLLGAVYSGRHDETHAREVLLEGLRRHPDLLRNHIYMARVIWVETGSYQNVTKWEMECARGDRMRFVGISLPPDILAPTGK